MCGICGILDLRGSGFLGEELEAMSNVLRHRGPDDRGSFHSGPVAFGFQRLSIVDLSGGHQPMCNEDRSVWIVFNGEIYNHAELRPRLEKLGHRFASNSDTETIVHLYEEYGNDCVSHLRGMFAFAIWDARRNRLFCARDRLGIKPFYFAMTSERFAFASEIKALFELRDFKASLNRRALPEFFTFGYLAAQETLYQNVHKLLPGNRLCIDLTAENPQPQVTEYWDLNNVPPENPLGEAQCISQFRELFTETVRSHLMSDVPLGVFLSGGLDSSAIAAVMASLKKEPIQTFSVGYAENQYSELPYGRAVAKHIGAEYNEVILGPEDFFATLPRLIWHEDEPLVWPSSVALFFVSRLASEKVKVVLTGEGGDELFAGYLKYRVALWNLRGGPLYRAIVPQFVRQTVRKALSSEVGPDWMLRKLRHSFLYDPESFEQVYFDNFYAAFPQQQQPQLFDNALNDELCDVNAYANSMQYFPASGLNGNALNDLLYLDIKTYLVELLMKQDQMSMAASIESRVPFLDHKVVEFAAGLPARYKLRFSSGKYLLRKAMTRDLPPEVLKRNKKGFPTPIRPWLRNQLFEKLKVILTDGRLAERRLVKPGYVEYLLNAHRQGSSSATEGCWRLLNFELWCRIFLDRDDTVRSSQPTREHFAFCGPGSGKYSEVVLPS
ncbi:MAG: asparagine synthase (glutamine-hydrolyzing) [Acidobacteria bacterium]|nr:MAG: asparagine synthase (glutamine-hydrolyzing) [Acidobacteriota bacterium]